MSIKQGTITRRLNTTFDELQEEFRSICEKKDFDKKLAEVKAANGKSNYASKLRDLFDMFDACKITYERGKDFKYYSDLVNKSKNILDTEHIEKKVLATLYKRFDNYPTPEDYMKRLVDRLCKKEDNWQEDTLRLRILKQFIKYGNCLSYQITRDGHKKTINIYCGKAHIRKYLKAKVANFKNELHNINDLEDDIFDVLKTAEKEQKRPSGTYGILKMADDLAHGKFRTGGQTKKSLYLFAMVYNMSFFSKSSSFVDPDTDIEINLFRDYYSSNLMRFITDAYKGKLCEYDLDPSGQGINYKNFAEMVYLYYISKDCEPQEKIIASNEMIYELLRNKPKKNKKVQKTSDVTKGTRLYKGLVKQIDGICCEDILDTDEKDFMKKLADNDFDFVIPRNSNEMQIATEQKTAYRVYKNIVNTIKKNDILCDYGICFADADAIKAMFSETDVSDPKKFDDFVELMVRVNAFVLDKAETLKENTPEEDTPKEITPKEITRAALIVVCYYYYNHSRIGDSYNEWPNFGELFADFKSDIDPILEEANYQPISERNIFDVLIAFSSYAYLVG